MISSKAVANLLSALALLLFVSMATTRRLNFDESLALRAGWLDLSGDAAEPAFLMPWTLFCGTVAHAFRDPGTTFVILRLVTAGAVAAAFAAALRTVEASSWRGAGAAWLAIGNAAFATHALEFRYDAAVLILLLVAYRALIRGTSPFWFGALAALLALHHLKGLFFAIGVVAIYLAVADDRLRSLRRLGVGASTALSLWSGLVLISGLGARFVASLRTFATLAAGSARASLADALGPVLLRDLAWWLLVATGIVLALAGRPADGACRRRRLLALAFAGLGIAFWVAHPRAWAYLVALPAPFLILAVVGDSTRPLRVGQLLTACALGLAIQIPLAASRPFFHLLSAYASPMKDEVSMLRALRDDLAPDDAILDPSGLAYFVRPCTREWYVDTLFHPRVVAGTWMNELAGGVPPACTLALNSYRLDALPAAARADLQRDFVARPSGLAVRDGRRSLPTVDRLPGTGRVESFW